MLQKLIKLEMKSLMDEDALFVMKDIPGNDDLYQDYSLDHLDDDHMPDCGCVDCGHHDDHHIDHDGHHDGVHDDHHDEHRDNDHHDCHHRPAIKARSPITIIL